MKKSPTKPVTRKESKEKTREALLRAGMDLFAEEGLDGPSLDAICDRAGYTRGAFYVHFEDREDFLVAVMDQVGIAFLDSLTGGRSDDDADFATFAMRFVRAFSEGSYPLAPEGGIRPHQLLDACARSERVRRRYAALVADSIGRTATVLARDQGRGGVRPDVDAHTLAGILLAAVIGAQTMLELGVSFDLAEAATTLHRLMTPR